MPTQLGKHWWPDWSLVEGMRVDYLSPTLYLTDILLVLLSCLLLLKSRIILNFSRLFEPRFLRFQPGQFSIFISYLFIISYLLFITLSSPRPWLAVYWLARYGQIPLTVWAVGETKKQLGKMRTKMLARRGLITAMIFAIGLGMIQIGIGRTTGWFFLFGERTFNLSTPGIATIAVLGKKILRPYSIFPHPNAMGGWIAAVVLVLKSPLLAEKKSRWQNRAVMLIGSVGVIITASRSAIIGLMGGIGFDTLIDGLKESRGIIMFPIDSVRGRLVLAWSAIRMIVKSPILGVGPGHYLVRLPNYLTGADWGLQPVHNIPLLILAEVGFAGLAIVTIGTIKTINKISEAYKINIKKILVPLAILLLVTGMLDHYWITAQQNRLLLGTLLGLMSTKDKT